jgi:hypothetical protein
MGGRAALVLAFSAVACSGEISGSPAGDAAPGLPDAPASHDAPATVDATVTAPACPTVAHIGDSLTAGTLAPLTAAYQAVGTTATLDAFGGRAVLQKLAADPKTGKQAALDFRAAGFDGCWVVALGTNDTANVAAGASYTRAGSIDEMMMAIDPARAARVLWVNTYTTRSDGYYDNANMILYNQELEAARGRWPNLRVFDWAAIAASGSAPFVDGIHHTSAGYAVRNQAIAGALSLLAPR